MSKKHHNVHKPHNVQANPPPWDDEYAQTKPVNGSKFSHTTAVSTTTVGRCFESHPPLPIGEFKIYGGSCSRPVVKDADIYIGFDHSMLKTHRQYPWTDGTEFMFLIPDMGIPPDADHFKKMVEWVSVQLAANKKVHVGCIGGHGRTGTFLAALVNVMTGDKNATEYVRKNYCQKAVESEAQINFLHQHYGITKATPTKSWGGGHTGPRQEYRGLTTYTPPPVYRGSNSGPGPTAHKALPSAYATPLKECQFRIWGSNVSLS